MQGMDVAAHDRHDTPLHRSEKAPTPPRVCRPLPHRTAPQEAVGKVWKARAMTHYVSHLVIGAGAMGLATSWRLAQRGVAPLTLERFERGHTRGASHGATRNFNNAYAQPHYLDLLAEARAGWDELRGIAGEPMLRLHGLVTHGDDAQVAAIAEALHKRGADVRVDSPAQAAARYTGMRFDGDVLVSRDAGVIRADAALRALESAAAAGGADIRFGHRVLSIDERADGVHARVAVGSGASATEHYDVVADTVVVTAGAWTEPLIGSVLELPRLTVTEEAPAHFAERGATHEWPSFNHLLAARPEYPATVYGMPAPGEGVKVGFHRVGPVVDPDARTFTPVPALDERLRDYVREWFPGLDADASTPISCTYTNTDSEDFVLDRRGRIIVGAGFSGHGFKFTPAVGAVLARLATDDGARAAEPFLLA